MEADQSGSGSSEPIRPEVSRRRPRTRTSLRPKEAEAATTRWNCSMQMIVFMISLCLAVSNASGLKFENSSASSSAAPSDTSTAGAGNIAGDWQHLSGAGQTQIGAGEQVAKRSPSSSPPPSPLSALDEDDEESNYGNEDELANELGPNEIVARLNETSGEQRKNGGPVNHNHRHQQQQQQQNQRNQLQSSQPFKAINRFELPDRTVQQEPKTNQDNLANDDKSSLANEEDDDNYDEFNRKLVARNSTNLISSLFSHIDKQWNFAEVILIIVISAILNLVTIVGNIMVLISFKMDRSLQTVSNYFLLSLALADLLIGLISMPLYTLYLLLNYWPLGALMCDIWLAIDYLNSNAAVLNMLIISFDRYFSVTRPLTYRAKRTTKHACLMISCAWILSLTIWTPAIFTYPYYKGARTVQGTDKCEIEFVKANSYLTFVTAILAFYIPVIIMIYLYWRIWLETKKRYRDLTTLFLVSGVGAAAPARATRPMLHAISNQLGASGAKQQANSATPPINRQSSIKRGSGGFAGATPPPPPPFPVQQPRQVANSVRPTNYPALALQQHHSDQQAQEGAASIASKRRQHDGDSPEPGDASPRPITGQQPTIGGKLASSNAKSSQSGGAGDSPLRSPRQANQTKCKCPCCPRIVSISCKKSKKAARCHCAKGAAGCGHRAPSDCPRCISELKADRQVNDSPTEPKIDGSKQRTRSNAGHHHHHHHHNHSHCNKAAHHNQQSSHSRATTRHCDHGDLLPKHHHHHQNKKPSPAKQAAAGCTCPIGTSKRKLKGSGCQNGDEIHLDSQQHQQQGDKLQGKLSLLTSSYHQLLSTSSSSLTHKVHPTATSTSATLTTRPTEDSNSFLSLAQVSSGDQVSEDEKCVNKTEDLKTDQSNRAKLVTTKDTATSPIEFPSSPVSGGPFASFDGSSEPDDDRQHEDNLETRIVAGGDRLHIKSDKLSVSQMLINFHSGVSVQKRPQQETPARSNPSKRTSNCAYCLQYKSTGNLANNCHRRPVSGQRRCCCEIIMAHDADCRLCNVNIDRGQKLHSKSTKNCNECRQLNTPVAQPRSGEQGLTKAQRNTTNESQTTELDAKVSLQLENNIKPQKTEPSETVSKAEEARSNALGEVKLPILGPLSKCSEEPERYVGSAVGQKALKDCGPTWNQSANLLHKTSSSMSNDSSLNGANFKNRRKSPKKFNQRLTFASGSPANKTSPNNSESGNNNHHQSSYSSSKPSTYSSHHPIQPKSERKAAKTLSTLLLVFIVTWLPYNVLVLIKTLSGGEDQVPEKIWNFSYYLCYINSTINPLCYALCNAQFRRTYMRILKCKLSNEQHNSTRRLVPIQSSTTWNKDIRIAHSTDGNPTTLTSSNSNNHN